MDLDANIFSFDLIRWEVTTTRFKV